MCVQLLSHVQFYATPWTVAYQASLSMGFPRQEYWSGLPLPSPEDIPTPGIEPTSLASPILAGIFFTTVPPKKYFLLVLSKIDLLDMQKSWGQRVEDILFLNILFHDVRKVTRIQKVSSSSNHFAYLRYRSHCQILGKREKVSSKATAPQTASNKISNLSHQWNSIYELEI